MRLIRIDHVSLEVSDRARSIGWYEEVLGLGPSVYFDDPDGTTLEVMKVPG